MSRQQPNLDLYYDLCVAIEQGMWDAGLICPDDRTVAYIGEDGLPRWAAPEPVIAAIVGRCTTVFAVHGVEPPRSRSVGKDGLPRK